ncbi:uncharacterized protein PgNI_00564, partial [Pyricularia grisea]|uniref:Uncharacterized protein n=1 Tax=Pyricularia grisea TaxID=148305 RepID=A0A6P8BHN4_PYRGI
MVAHGGVVTRSKISFILGAIVNPFVLIRFGIARLHLTPATLEAHWELVRRRGTDLSEGSVARLTVELDHGPGLDTVEPVGKPLVDY